MLPFVSEKGSDLRPPERESRPVQHETTSYYKIITVNHPAIMSTAKKASAVSSKKQAVADDNLKKFYLELAHRLCSPPENPESENAWLWKLHTTSQRMSRLFTTLNEHAAFDQVTTIHRACGYFLMKNDVPQKERRQVIEVVGSVRRDDASASVHRPDAGGTDPPHPRNPEAGLARRRKRLCRRVCRGRGRSRSRPRFRSRQETDRQERLRQGVIPAGASAGFRTPGRDEKPLRQEGRAGMRFHAEKASSPENPP